MLERYFLILIFTIGGITNSATVQSKIIRHTLPSDNVITATNTLEYAASLLVSTNNFNNTHVKTGLHCRNVDNTQNTDNHYSIFSSQSIGCRNDLATQYKSKQFDTAPYSYKVLNDQLLHAELAGFATIYFGQVYGGTDALSRLWYTSALLAPNLLEKDRLYGRKKNYLALTPSLILLGQLNEYLSRDSASESRIFISNFIGFNFVLAWKYWVQKSPHLFFRQGNARSKVHRLSNKGTLNTSLLPSKNGFYLNIRLTN